MHSLGVLFFSGSTTGSVTWVYIARLQLFTNSITNKLLMTLFSQFIAFYYSVSVFASAPLLHWLFARRTGTLISFSKYDFYTNKIIIVYFMTRSLAGMNSTRKNLLARSSTNWNLICTCISKISTS